MYHYLRDALKKTKATLFNLPGYRTREKLVIFDSDDWGSIRVPGKQQRNQLISMGIDMNDNCYNQYDCLENEDDLAALYEVLKNHKDTHGYHPTFEMNTVMTNPDFDRIAEGNYSQYHCEDFITTYQRYWQKDLMPLWRQGMDAGLVFPQFHAREHLNVSLWMKALQQGEKLTLSAFKYGFFGQSGMTPSIHHPHYLAAFHHQNTEDLEDKKVILSAGLDAFEEVFGYRSRSWIACNYTWHCELEHVALDHGVNIVKSQRAQLQPDVHTGKLNPKYHFTGQKNQFHQRYLVRNAIFEPAENPSYDWVNSCLNDIHLAFALGKPAIISSHRVNYIGSISEENRTENLKALDKLIKQMLISWPDIRFCSSIDIF